ncbi:MAG: hypothetical protein ABJD13_20910 [Paracoccaceae bacterium]
METHFLITSSEFSATAGELDDEHDDYINPGLYALEFANFLERELTQRGYPAKFRCQEDWGHWMELEHQGKFTLAVCCASTGEDIDGQAEHRVFLSPDKPVIRRFFKKVDVRSELEQLAATLRDVLESSSIIKNLRIEP